MQNVRRDKKGGRGPQGKGGLERKEKFGEMSLPMGRFNKIE